MQGPLVYYGYWKQIKVVNKNYVLVAVFPLLGNT